MEFNALGFYFFWWQTKTFVHGIFHSIKNINKSSSQTKLRTTKMKNSFHTLDSSMNFHFLCRLLGNLGVRFWTRNNNTISYENWNHIPLFCAQFPIFPCHSLRIEGLLLFNHGLRSNTECDSYTTTGKMEFY